MAAADVQLTKPEGAWEWPQHMCRSCMASEASFILKAALQPCLVIRVSTDEVTTATPDIYSGSPQQDTHIQTHPRVHTRSVRKRSTCSRGPVRCSGCNHPRLLTNNHQNNNSSFNSNTNNQVKWSNTSIQPQVHCAITAQQQLEIDAYFHPASQP